MKRYPSTAQPHQYGLLVFLLLYMAAAQATSVAIIQGKDFVVIAVDSKRTRIVNGAPIDADNGCKIRKAGKLYFVWTGASHEPQYDAEAIANTAASSADDPGEAAKKFESAITPKLETLIAAVDANPNRPDHQRIARKKLLLSMVFLTMHRTGPQLTICAITKMPPNQRAASTLPDEQQCRLRQYPTNVRGGQNQRTSGAKT